jgi:hypothetical protein
MSEGSTVGAFVGETEGCFVGDCDGSVEGADDTDGVVVGIKVPFIKDNAGLSVGPASCAIPNRAAPIIKTNCTA